MWHTVYSRARRMDCSDSRSDRADGSVLPHERHEPDDPGARMATSTLATIIKQTLHPLFDAF